MNQIYPRRKETGENSRKQLTEQISSPCHPFSDVAFDHFSGLLINLGCSTSYILSEGSVFFPYGVEGSGRWSESGVEGSTGATSLRGPGVEGMKSGT